MFRFQRSQAAVASLLFAVLGVQAPDAAAFSVYKVDLSCVDRGAYPTIQAAIDAAAANPGTDYVWIANTSTYSGEHIIIADPDGVIVEGGFADCDDFDPGTDTTLVSGAGNGGGSVFDIVGPSNAALSNLSIAFASSADDAGGGGIAFTGDGTVTLAATSVFLNNAGYGAGISVAASGGHAELVLHDDVVITNNTAAHSGGGIRLDGDARLIVVGTGTSIVNNTAAEYGGGIEILGPARADIGAVGGGGGPAINHNSAGNGGGVAVIDNGNGEAVLRTFAHDSTHPTTFNQNRADIDGGAIYLTGRANACLHGSRFSNNVAEDGAAIYMTYYIADGTGGHDDSGGVYISVAGPTECDPESIAELGGSQSCSIDTCSTFSGHVTKHADDTPSAGAVISTYLNTLNGRYVRLQNNTAASVLYGGAGIMAFSTCLITDNSASGALISGGAVFAGYTMSFEHCTIANNTIGGTHVIDRGQTGTVKLDYDIIDMPGKSVVSTGFGYQEKHLDVGYTIATQLDGLPIDANPSIVAAIAQFRDVANQDYHQRASSPGVDFGPLSGGIDLDGTLGTFDLPQVPNRFGAADLGAYELTTAFTCDASSDAVYCDGFED